MGTADQTPTESDFHPKHSSTKVPAFPMLPHEQRERCTDRTNEENQTIDKLQREVENLEKTIDHPRNGAGNDNTYQDWSGGADQPNESMASENQPTKDKDRLSLKRCLREEMKGEDFESTDA